MAYKTFTGESIQEAVAAAKLEFGKQFQIVNQEKKVHRTGLFGLFGKKEFYQLVVSYDENQKPARRSPRADELEKQEVLNRIASIISERRNLQSPVNTNAIPGASHLQPSGADPHNPPARSGVAEEIAELKEMLGPLLRGAGLPKGRHGHFEQVRTFLESNDFTDDFIERALDHLGTKLTCKQSKDEGLVRKELESWLLGSVKTGKPDFDDETGPRMITLVGPTGVGKTTTLAKIGAELALTRGKRVAFITMDNYRIGAEEQIAKYADIIGSSVRMVHQRDELQWIIDEGNYDYYLMDTAGRNQKKEMQIGEIRRFLSAVHIPHEVHLAVSATTKYRDLVEIMRNFAPLKYSHILVTKIDETNTYGSLLSALSESEKNLVWLCMGQEVPTDIKPADARDFVDRIMMRYQFGNEKPERGPVGDLVLS